MRYETEMKDGIVNFLKNGQNCKDIINELDSGFGVADFVGMTNTNSKAIFHFKNKIDVYFLRKMQINQPVLIDEIERDVHYSRKYLKNVILKLYKKQGLLDEIEKDVFVRLTELDANGFLLIAVEAKLSRWKQALKQAALYKRFADYSFVALYAKYTKNVDHILFREKNIGLVSIDDNMNFDVNIKPKLNKQYYQESKLFVSGLTLDKEN